VKPRNQLRQGSGEGAEPPDRFPVPPAPGASGKTALGERLTDWETRQRPGLCPLRGTGGQGAPTRQAKASRHPGRPAGAMPAPVSGGGRQRDS